MTTSLDKTIDLRHYFRLIRRRKGIILLCTVVTLCATFVALAFAPSVYESEVTLMIEDSQLLSRELENLMGGIGQPDRGRTAHEERLEQLIGRIRSRPFLERVIGMLKMTDDPVVRARAGERRRKHPEISLNEMATRILVENLQSRIRFARTGSSIYKIIVADYSAENAQLLARWISELFVDISSQEMLDRIRTAHEFGVEQLRIYEEQLRQSEDALEAYKQSVIERSLDQSLVRAENLVSAEALQRRVADEVSMARMRLRPYSQALESLGQDAEQRAVLQDPEIRELATSLVAALKNELTDRLAEHASEVVDWQLPGIYGTLRQNLLKEVEDVTAQHYPDEEPHVINAIAMYVFSKVDLDAQLSASRMLRGAIADFRARAGSTPGGEIELTRLENEVATNRRLLQSFQTQLVASDLSRAVEMTKLGLQIEILDPAHQPLSPSRPNRLKILLASLLLGPLLGAGLAFATETADPVLRTLEDFARVIPEPILGTTPLLSRLVVQHSWFRRHWIAVSMAGVLVVTATFFVVRSSLLHNMAAVRVPVQLVDPEGELTNEDH